MVMTEEQIKQNAETYARQVTNSNSKKELCTTINDFIAGAHSRDEEIEQLKNDYHYMFCELVNKVEQLRNPWISGEKHPTDVTKDYLLKYEDGSHIVAMWDSGMWMSKDLHPLKNPKKWIPIPELKKGE